MVGIGVKNEFPRSYFLHIFQCMSSCWCGILDSFSIFGNKVVLACLHCQLLLCPQILLMMYKLGLPRVCLYSFNPFLTLYKPIIVLILKLGVWDICLYSWFKFDKMKRLRTKIRTCFSLLKWNSFLLECILLQWNSEICEAEISLTVLRNDFRWIRMRTFL